MPSNFEDTAKISKTLVLDDLEKFRYTKSKIQFGLEMSTPLELDNKSDMPNLIDDRSMTPPLPGCLEVNGNHSQFIPETPESQIGRIKCDSDEDDVSPIKRKKKSGKRFVLSDSDSENETEHLKKKKKELGRKSMVTVESFPLNPAFYTNKELGLISLKEAFPNLDLMEIQDVLVNCNWNAGKAFHILKDGCSIKKCNHFSDQLEEESPEERKPVSRTIPKPTAQTRTIKEDNNLDKWISKREESPPRMETKRKVQQLSSSSEDEVACQETDENKQQEISRQKTHQLSENEDDDDLKKENGLKTVENPKKTHRRFKKTSQPKQKKAHKIKKKKRKGFEADSDDNEEDYKGDDVYNSDDSDEEFCAGDPLSPARLAVLNFFQEAATLELLMVPGCSKKRLDNVVANRPYNDWGDLVKKFQTGKSLSTDLLNGASEVIHMRDVMTKLLQRCEKFSREMEEIVRRIKESDNGNLEHIGCVTKQPISLNKSMTLAPYQMYGLNWLYVMHMQQLNGILADEMGLGKTIQAIAFLAHLLEVGIMGPHLIVVPSSTMNNWKREIETWCDSLTVICYKGSQEERRELRLQLVNNEIVGYQILLTTYNMVTSSAEDRTLFRKLGFNYVIFDEAHMLKNMDSIRYKNLMKIKADRRLCLTGTPLQNNLVELMSLLIFVMPDMFRGKIDQVKRMFTTACKSEEGRSSHERERIEQAKRIMKPFVLRRLKVDVLKQLPKKLEQIKYCPLSESQKIMYEELVSNLKTQINNKKTNQTSERLSGMVMLMELRKSSNHPLLRRIIYVDKTLRKMAKLMLKEPTHCEANADLIFEDMQVMSDFQLHKLCKMYKSINSFDLEAKDILNSGKFLALDEMLPPGKEKGERILIFSQFTIMLDVLEEYMQLRGHSYIRLDGATPVNDRQDLIDKYNEDTSIFVFLLSTRAGGLGINLTAANKVLLHDIDYNPYNDKQAEDRVHRVGQTREVTIIRMISTGTVEEGMLSCAQEKLRLGRDITSEEQDEDDSKSLANKLLQSALHFKPSKNDNVIV